MVPRSVNRGRQRRRHELHLSTLTTTRRTHPATTLGTPVQMANCDLPATGLTSRTWAHSPKRRRSLYVRWQVPPSIYKQKEYHKYPGPAASHDVTPPAVFPRIFPQDASRAEREFVRAQRRPGLPRDQFSGPWLFSTAEARTINSSSSSSMNIMGSSLAISHNRR